MKNDLQLILAEQNVAKENAKQLIEAFGAPFTEAGEILSTYKKIEVTDESQKDLMAEAREKRLTLKKIRTGVETKRKELKEDALRTGKAIDGVAKYIKDNIQPAEEYLELQEKFAEIKEAERAALLKAERIEILSKYTDNLSVYNFDIMQQETFDTLLADLKGAYDERIEQEKQAQEAAEKARLDEIARQEAIAAENAKLKAEAKAREMQLAIERKEAAAKQAEIDAAKEKELFKERAKAESERVKREQLEKEHREKEEAIARESARIAAEEARAKEAADKLERDALLAPDKDKLINFSKALEIIRKEKLPAVKTKQAQDVVNLIDEMLIKMQDIITKKAKEL
jgi:hypothetical protein